MSVFAMSDTHLSLSADKSMEVFAGWQNYVERIERNWRAIVSDEDVVVMPGDISWAMHLCDTFEDFSFINSLPGKKIILKGNHDLWWQSISKMNAYLADNKFDTISFLHNSCYNEQGLCITGSRGWLTEPGSEHDEKIIAREAGRLRLSLDAARSVGNADPTVFLHYPPVVHGAVCDEILDVIREYGVKQVYYGHIHRGSYFKAFNGVYDGIHFRCVSADMVDFTPVKII